MKHILHRLSERLIYLQKTLDFQKPLQESLDFFLHPKMEFLLYLNRLCFVASRNFVDHNYEIQKSNDFQLCLKAY